MCMYSRNTQTSCFPSRPSASSKHRLSRRNCLLMATSSLHGHSRGISATNPAYYWIPSAASGRPNRAIVTFGNMMTVKQLKKIIAKLPDNTPVMMVTSKSPACRTRDAWIAQASCAELTSSGCLSIRNTASL